MDTLPAFATQVNPLPTADFYYSLIVDGQLAATGYRFPEALAVLAALEGLATVQVVATPER